MDIADFKRTLSGAAPPADAGGPLAALWHDANGDWERAHVTVQDDSSREAAWVHAYLHRKEGDVANAGYWYRRAGRPTAGGELEAEWTTIVAALLTAP